MANQRFTRQEDHAPDHEDEDEINNRIIQENIFSRRMAQDLSSTTDVESPQTVPPNEAVDGSSHSRRPNHGNVNPVPRPRHPNTPGTGNAVIPTVQRASPNIPLENSSQDVIPTVSIRRRQTPLDSASRNPQLPEGERERHFLGRRAVYLQEYLSMADPSLNTRLNMCAELMNVDVDINLKYTVLELLRVLDANKEKSRFVHLTQGLGILEKYASNLIKDQRPPYWRTVKFTSSLVQVHVGRLIGSRDILRQMGYIRDIADGVAFPEGLAEPNVNMLRNLAADLFFARYEIDALLVNRHPFYEITPPIPQDEVELPQLFRANYPLSRPLPFPPNTSNSVFQSSQSSPSSGQIPGPTPAPSTRSSGVSPSPQSRHWTSPSPSFPNPATRRQGGKEPIEPSDGKQVNQEKIVLVVSETTRQPQALAERTAESEEVSEDSDTYEDADDGMSTALPHASPDGIECRICGQSIATEFCNDCKDTFCKSCDGMYHRHPSRLRHVRRTLMAPTETTSTMPPATSTAVGTETAIQPTRVASPTAASSSGDNGDNGDKPRVKKPPVPAPRRNISVKSPPNQVMAQDAKKPEPKGDEPPPPVPPRLPHGAPYTGAVRQPQPLSPRQPRVLSPASPPPVSSGAFPPVTIHGLGQQPVPTAASNQVSNLKGRDQIRRPPPFITNNTTGRERTQQNKEEPKTRTQAPPPLPPKPQAQPKAPTAGKAADFKGPARPEEDGALSCPNCFCLNSSTAKTCVACKKTLTGKGNQQPASQTPAPTWNSQPPHSDVGAFQSPAWQPPPGQVAGMGQTQLWQGRQQTNMGTATRPEEVSRMPQPGYQPYPPPVNVSGQVHFPTGTHWECVYCTYINPVARLICDMCCKTRSTPLIPHGEPSRRDFEVQQLPPNENQVETRSSLPYHVHAGDIRTEDARQQHSLLTGQAPDQSALRSPLPADQVIRQTGLPGNVMNTPLNSSPYAGDDIRAFPSAPPPMTAMQFQQTQASSFPSPIGNSMFQQSISPGPLLTASVESPVEETMQREQEEIYVSGLRYVEWLKKGEIEGFSPEEVNIASVLGCEDPQGPIHWLQTAWYDLIHNVMREVAVPENSQEIGNISHEEVREALIECTGNVSESVKKCIEVRKEKVRKLQQSGVYAKTDCISALDDAGDIEKATLTLEKMSLEPMLQRVLDSCLPDSTTEEEVMQVLTRQLNTQTSQDQDNFRAIVSDPGQDMDRRIRAVLAEKGLQSWGRAETAIKLIDQNHSVEDSIEAACSCGDIHRALRFLKQECPLCFDEKPMTQMFTFLHCQDRVCQDCVQQHVTLTIRDKNIMHLVCPICGKPDNLEDEAVALEYFNNLDIVLRGLVSDEVHDLFQRKICDRTLMKEPNFRWCSHCSSGFINEQPGHLKMMCPHCQHFTCFRCKRQWEDQHDNITCEEFTAWKEANDPEFQAAGLAAHLRKNGIECPHCKFRYDLSKGGCMHFKCAQCAHEFCSGCYNPFNHGARCGVSDTCGGKGLHAHHPRDCYFYLRDRQPEELQRLLRDNNVPYNTDPPEAQAEEANSDDEEEPQGAVAALRCKVNEQKDGGNGMVDEECGGEVPAGYAGLCRNHYIEYLVVLVNDNLIDPADIMTSEDLITVLKRGEVEPPEKQNRVNDNQYHAILLQTVKQQLPLPPKPPRKRVLDDEYEEEVPVAVGGVDVVVDDEDDDSDIELGEFDHDGGGNYFGLEPEDDMY